MKQILGRRKFFKGMILAIANLFCIATVKGDSSPDRNYLVSEKRKYLIRYDGKRLIYECDNCKGLAVFILVSKNNFKCELCQRNLCLKEVKAK